MQKLRPDLDIGYNIQRLRYQAEMTQGQVVDKLNLMDLKISKSSYAKIETNRQNLRISELVALKLIFNVDYKDFFVGLKV